MTEQTPQNEDRPTDARLTFKRHGTIAWILTAFTLATYFILMLTVALAPSMLTRTITADSALPVGIVAGIIIIIVLIVVAAVFTVWTNKLDDPP